MPGRHNALPPLAAAREVERALSGPEYYHACVGRSPHTLDGAREIVFVLEGRGALDPVQVQAALDRVVAVNPGLRLRMRGQLTRARWRSDGPPPRLRVVDDTGWDGGSERGAEFIQAAPLSLEQGPAIELIIERGPMPRLIVRALHAVVDGVGVMHLFEELFRALRGEALLGTNAVFSDVALMSSVASEPRNFRKLSVAYLAGGAEGSETGDRWLRLSLPVSPSNLLGRVAVAMAEFAARYSDLPVRIAVPVNLRRHCPGLLSTLNYSNMLHVDLAPGDSPADFREKLRAMLARNFDADYPRVLEAVRLFPLRWLDRLVSRTTKNYLARDVWETAVLSNLGQYSSNALSGGGFHGERLFGLPLKGNAFSILFSLDGRVDITVGMARAYSSNGRLEALVRFLRERLST